MTSLRLCAAVFLGALALVVAGCGGGASTASEVSGEPISFEQLAHSALTSADSTSGRFSFAMSASIPGEDDAFSLSGEGAFDAASGRSSFALDMSSLAKLLGGLVAGFGGAGGGDMPDFDDPAGWKIEVVQDGKVGFVRLPALADQLPDGKTWVRGTGGDVKAGGLDFESLESFTGSDPRDVLEALRGVGGEIETVGSEELRGVETTHYRALVDPARIAKDAAKGGAGSSFLDPLTSSPALADAVPLDVWIDADGLVRKIAIEMTSTDPNASSAGEASLEFELWDYGKPVDIELPPASQVAEASDLRG